MLGNKIMKTLVILASLLFLACCSKDVDITLTPKQHYFVTGSITNLSASIQLFETTQSMSLATVNADVRIRYLNNEVQLMNASDSLYQAKDFYMPPGSAYQLYVTIGSYTGRYDGSIPDSVSSAVLTITDDGSENYQFNLRVDKTIAEDGYGYLWYNGGADYLSEPNLFLPYNYVSEYSFINSIHTNFNISNLCLSPIPFDKEFQAKIQRIDQNRHSFIEYQKLFIENQTNPLLIRYQSPLDVVQEDLVFRIFEGTDIYTNKVSIIDDTPKPIEIYLYDKNGFPLSPEIYKAINLYINSPEKQTGLFIDVQPTNPSFVSENKLKILSKKRCSDAINIAGLINKEIIISAWGNDGAGTQILAEQTITLSNLTDKQTIKLRLK
jgi:uncharacterized lipoprotein YmbA